MKERHTIPTVLPEQFRKKYFNAAWRGDVYLQDFNSFYLHKIESSCHSLKLPSLPYRSTAHECVLLTHGAMVRSSGLQAYSVKSGSVFFVPAGQITTIESITRIAKGFYCHFDASVLTRKFTNLQLIEEFGFLGTMTAPVVQLPAKAVAQLVYLFERMNEEQSGRAGG